MVRFNIEFPASIVRIRGEKMTTNLVMVSSCIASNVPVGPFGGETIFSDGFSFSYRLVWRNAGVGCSDEEEGLGRE